MRIKGMASIGMLSLSACCGGGGGEGRAAKKTDFVYDQSGRIIGYTEQTRDSKTPVEHAATHIMTYNQLGQVEGEVVIDHETGRISNLEALRETLARMSSTEFDSFFRQLNADARAAILRAFEASSENDLRARIRRR